MGPASFLAGLFGASFALLAIAALTAVAVTYCLPPRLATAARMCVEWAAPLSGAGCIVLLFSRYSAAGAANLSFVPPALLGAVVSLSYFSLCVMLLLRVLEPRWAILPAARALGLSVHRTLRHACASSAHDMCAALAIYAARLLADATVIIWVLFHHPPSVVLGQAAAMWLMPARLATLVRSSGLPAYAPLFGPLPELPSRLGLTLRVAAVERMLLQLSLAVVLAVAALALTGLGMLENWHTADSPPVTVLKVAIQCALPLLAVCGLLLWRWMSHQCNRVPTYNPAVALAALSPALYAYPTVALLHHPWYVWLSLGVLGLATYVVVQDRAARAVYALVVRQTLTPGEASPAAAAAALGLPPTAPCDGGPLISQALSAASVWFASAAMLSIVSDASTAISAAHALVWGVVAAVLQTAALWLRSTMPRPRLGAEYATLEALSHETA